MDIVSYDLERDHVTIDMNNEEVWFLLQAMSELCDGTGIPDIEFNTRIGFDRSDGQSIISILACAHRLFRERN